MLTVLKNYLFCVKYSSGYKVPSKYIKKYGAGSVEQGGYRLQITGYWLQVTGYRLLVAGLS
jgi:hypothetical protein